MPSRLSIQAGADAKGFDVRETSVIEIDLTRLDHNINRLREFIGPDCALCPIVKADAYGLGAERIVPRMVAAGVEMLAVYTPDQAAEILSGAVGTPILILMPVRDPSELEDLYRALVSEGIHLTVHDPSHVDVIIAAADRFGTTMPVHLEVDTGMSRGGCSIDDVPEVLTRIAASRRLQLAGLFTHFASPDFDISFTDEQAAEFDEVLAEHDDLIPPNCRFHMANTFATLRHARYHRSMVRVGLAWAGCGVECMDGKQVIDGADSLLPIARWRSRIVHTRWIDRGTPVGYDSIWKAPRRTLIGLVPVGYADGYPAALRSEGRKSRRGSVAVTGATPHGQDIIGFAPVVGAVSMDQITIDLTDVYRNARKVGQSVDVGTDVELITPDAEAPNHLPALAELAETIPHELLCRLNPRVKRSYLTAPVDDESRSTKLTTLVG